MLYNGLCAVVDGTLARLPQTARAHTFRDALLLGSLREDVAILPGGRVVEHLSLTHQTGRLPGGFVPFLVPSPHQRVRWLVRRAAAGCARGDLLRAYATLGRALHLVADLACPAHASRTVHLRDPFEGWVEVHGYELIELPPLEIPRGSLPELTSALVERARAHPADGTTSPWGRILHRLGLRAPLSPETVAQQARELVPLAMATGAALLARFEEG